MSAVPDIRIPVDFLRHRKTRKLIRRLGHEAVTALIQLWCYAAERPMNEQLRLQGDLSALTAREIAQAAGWTGDPHQLVAAWVEVGFVDYIGGSLRLHEWRQHQPRASRLRFWRTKIPQAIRAAVVGRCGPVCHWCGLVGVADGASVQPAAAGGEPFHLDHLVPVSHGGGNEPENLVVACRHCNISRGAGRWS